MTLLQVTPMLYAEWVQSLGLKLRVGLLKTHLVDRLLRDVLRRPRRRLDGVEIQAVASESLLCLGDAALNRRLQQEVSTVGGWHILWTTSWHQHPPSYGAATAESEPRRQLLWLKIASMCVSCNCSDGV